MSKHVSGSRSWFLVSAGVCAALSCGGGSAEPTHPQAPQSALAPSSQGSLGRIEVKQLDARPRLTLVSRDGDPFPALVVAVATDLGPVGTTALAAVLESRLQAAGFDVDTRVDRSALRLRWLATEPARVQSFLASVSNAFRQPLAPNGPELATAAQRLQALKRNPLDAPELVPVAGCTGVLGVAGTDPVADVTTPSGLREVDGWRRAALSVGRTSIAAVGPSSFCASAAQALAKVAGWEPGPTAADPVPTGDSTGVYASASLEKRAARATLAVRVGDARAAVAAAERLGAPDSPLLARLAAMQPPWRALEVAGVARPRGGCVSVTLEASRLPTSPPVERSAALALSVARQEFRLELARPVDPNVASRQILTGADPREAASRGAWWALSTTAAAPERWATVLALPPSAEMRPGAAGSAADTARQRFDAELATAIAGVGTPVSEKRLAVEQGQGELWVLLASPCGVADEGSEDAGGAALAAVAAVRTRRGDEGVSVEPWVTQDGIGVLAHAPFAGASEPAAQLARRVADAAARTLAAANISGDALAAARAATLARLEATGGRQAVAMDALASGLLPEHPSWVEPFGLWSRIASGGLESVRLRWQALASGPIRLAVLANTDRAQAAAAGEAAERWLGPRSAGSCRSAAPGATRPGRYEVRLPQGAALGHALVGAPVPPAGVATHDLAELTVAALDGAGGLLGGALRASLVAEATARLQGGSRASSLIIEVRAPADSLGAAVTEVKALLARLGQAGPTDADLARALAIRGRGQREARADPRRRLIDLWSGREAAAPTRPTLAAWRDFIATSLKDTSLVVVEALPE